MQVPGHWICFPVHEADMTVLIHCLDLHLNGCVLFIYNIFT
jgi:hypothetical protein